MFYNEADMADVTKDKILRFINPNLVDYKIESAGFSNPSQLTFNYNKDGVYDPELMLVGLISQTGNVYTIGDEVALDDDFETKSFRVGMSFQSNNEHFSSGISTLGSASPLLTITTTHLTAVPPTTKILSIVQVDALIEFRGSEIAISEVF